MTTNPYPALVTSEHQKPNFLAVIGAITQGHVDNQAVLAALSADFDLDKAVGVQLDAVGLWIGISRALKDPISDVYFSFDILGVGFDQGTWWQPGDPTSQLDLLPDDAYRLLLKAKIGANNWDGTVAEAYAIWNELFGPDGITVTVKDNQDMSTTVTLSGAPPSAVVLALLNNGSLDLKPAGVSVTYVT